MSVSRLLLVLLFGLQLSCSTLTEMTAEVPANWQKTLQHRSQVMSWKIQAKLGVQTEDNGGSFDLFWNQQGDAYQIRMIAPMGQGAILIRGDNRKVYVKTADGEEQYSNDVDAVLASRLGVNIPVAGLRDWLRGLPVKGEPVLVQKWDNRGQLAKLVQSGWNIDMSSYEKVAGYNLPHRFYFGRDDRPELGIRLLIRRWDQTGA
jgi:outer membrane lipoprotein LolB